MSDKSDTPRAKQIASALELMRHADKREVEYAYRDAIISDVGDMERELAAKAEECEALKASRAALLADRPEVAGAIAAINAAVCGEFLRHADQQAIADKFTPCEPKCECAGLLTARTTIESLAAKLALLAAPVGDGALRDLGAWLTSMLDESEWPDAERLLNAALLHQEALAAQLAQRDEEIARVKWHAENMCRTLQIGDGGFDRPETAAYRRDYPVTP